MEYPVFSASPEEAPSATLHTILQITAGISLLLDTAVTLGTLHTNFRNTNKPVKNLCHLCYELRQLRDECKRCSVE